MAPYYDFKCEKCGVILERFFSLRRDNNALVSAGTEIRSMVHNIPHHSVGAPTTGGQSAKIEWAVCPLLIVVRNYATRKAVYKCGEEKT
jgi:hypothetical protein